MKKETIIQQLRKKSNSLPILSFPIIQKLRITVNEFINSPTLQAQGMAYIANNYPTSAAIGLMDLSVEAEEFGSKIKVYEMEVPTITNRIINNIDDAINLKVPLVGSKRTKNYIKSINMVTSLTNKPVLAGVIGPFSLAGRLMDMTEIMINCYEFPDIVHLTLKKVSEYLLNYILAFKRNGANGVIIAEPAAGLLSPSLNDEFSSSYLKSIVDKVKDDSFLVFYHNCGNTLPLINSILNINADGYHFGNAVEIEKILPLMPKNKLVLGNLDPVKIFKNGNPAMIKSETKLLLTKLDSYENFIISSGCDLAPLTPWENIESFFEAVSEYYQGKL